MHAGCACSNVVEMWASVNKTLTCVSELLIPAHGENHQQVAKDVDHDGEDEHAPQSAGEPRRAAEGELVRGQRGNVRSCAAICVHLKAHFSVLGITHRCWHHGENFSSCLYLGLWAKN